MRKALLLIGLMPLSVAMAQTAKSGMAPNPPAKIAAATMDCWAVTGGATVDRAQLQSRGWQAGKLAFADGKPVASPLTFYSKTDSGVVILLSSEGKSAGACTVLSAVTSAQDIAVVATQVDSAVKAQVSGATMSKTETSILFAGGNRVALLQGTGTKDKPAARIIVAPKAVVEKK
ncbi:hypothetical protein [Sphingomonas sp. LY160]|uniref:hypothetical protein n=1 Tax=Sphingomonas sp. LY160 TaxID=3095342 RepID=UPI002ADEB946|nr:hypothetical protein [Sphingomonas sp. LY160]MEA1071876.1 hypothetical protein [Sphingomonas sp. LY160]